MGYVLTSFEQVVTTEISMGQVPSQQADVGPMLGQRQYFRWPNVAK